MSKYIGVHFLSSDANASKPVTRSQTRNFGVLPCPSTSAPIKPAAKQPAAKPEESDEDDSVDGPDQGLTKALALDCEMVRVNHGGKDSILARA